MILTAEIKLYVCAFAVLLLASIFCERKEKHSLALFLLTVGGFFVYFAAANLFPYLNIWDEQYHALVAKNCMRHPFAPILYDEAIVNANDYNCWISSHIWLHKQPLFLWQMALSFKLFGVSEVTARIPSVVLCTLMIPVCYRLAHLISGNRNTAYFTALCAACSWAFIRLTSGIASTDHNDVCFIFYVTASVWAFCEYIHHNRQNRLWIALIGIFACAAILTKWMTGLLVFFVWGVYLLSEYKFHIKEWKIWHILAALSITLALVVPWQIYILHQFPEVARQELLYNSQHFSQVIEGHGGTIWFYLIVLPMQYFGKGNYFNIEHFVWNSNTIFTYVVLLAGLIIMCFRLQKTSHKLTILAVLVFIYAFFTMAKTKMPSFTLIVCFIWFFAIGNVFSVIIEKSGRIFHHKAVQHLIFVVLACGFAFYYSNYPNYYIGTDEYYSSIFIKDKEIFKQWDKTLPAGCYVFNVKSSDISSYDVTTAIAGTFYSNRQCYAVLPSVNELHDLERRGIPVAVVNSPWITEEVAADSTIRKVEL